MRAPRNPDAVRAASFLIAARAENGVIGADGGIPWKSSGDMVHFRNSTMGCAVIMGRRTWDSLPGPLVGRFPVVVTGRPFVSPYGTHAADFDEAIEAALATDARAIAFAGGSSIYRAALDLPWLRRALVTRISRTPEGDAFMPDLGPEWTLKSRARLPRGPDEPEAAIESWVRPDSRDDANGH